MNINLVELLTFNNSGVSLLHNKRNTNLNTHIMTTEKKQLIKKLKAEANKAFSKVVAGTFDPNERNKAMLQIQALLAKKIKEVEAL